MYKKIHPVLLFENAKESSRATDKVEMSTNGSISWRIYSVVVILSPKHKDIWSNIMQVSTPKTGMTHSLLSLIILFTVYLIVCLFLKV